MNAALAGANRERDRRPIRFLVFGLMTILVFGLLTARLAYLQITSGTTLAAAAQQQRTAEEAIPATRGLIYDREGRLLVKNVATWAVKITPSDLPFADRDEVARRLAGLLGIEATDVLTTLDSAPGSRFDPVRIAQDVPEETARLVAESTDDLPGVQVVVETRREYPDGALLAHILGYTGPVDPDTWERLRGDGYLPDDMIGKTGVSPRSRSSCAGRTASRSSRRTRPAATSRCSRTRRSAVPGASLRLTIDRTIQREATQALKWGMRQSGIKRGAFIVMNPQTGEVLALVSLPSYDNNEFARGISIKDYAKLLHNKDQPLTNHAVQAHYPPGSTYKLVAGTGGLADGKITAQTRIQTRGYLTLAGARFYDWNRARLRRLQHELRVRALVGHLLLPGRRDARRGPARLLGPPVRVRQVRPASTCRARSRGSSRRTSGRSTPSAPRCSAARSTSPASARATTS